MKKIVELRIEVVVDYDHEDADLEAEARISEIPGVIYAKALKTRDAGSEWTTHLPSHGQWIHLAK